MRIGLLAQRAGITPSRVRFYEAQGLLPSPARRDSNYRDYDETALETLTLINRARTLGYTLKEIALYLAEPQGEGRRTLLLNCIDGKLAQFDAVLAETEGRQERLRHLREQLG